MIDVVTIQSSYQTCFVNAQNARRQDAFIVLENRKRKSQRGFVVISRNDWSTLWKGFLGHGIPLSIYRCKSFIFPAVKTPYFPLIFSLFP